MQPCTISLYHFSTSLAELTSWPMLYPAKNLHIFSLSLHRRTQNPPQPLGFSPPSDVPVAAPPQSSPRHLYENILRCGGTEVPPVLLKTQGMPPSLQQAVSHLFCHRAQPHTLPLNNFCLPGGSELATPPCRSAGSHAPQPHPVTGAQGHQTSTLPLCYYPKATHYCLSAL